MKQAKQKHAIFVYHDEGADRNVFETCLKTFRQNSPNSRIIIYTDDINAKFESELFDKYNVMLNTLPRLKIEGRRSVCKVECFTDYILRLRFPIPEEEYIIAVLDADLFFLRDAFDVLDYVNIKDIGLTSRGHPYWCDINGGVIFFRKNLNNALKIDAFVQEHRRQSENPTWEFYKEYQKKYNHTRFGQDWTRGQDYLNCVWLNRDSFDIDIKDVTNFFNYCPACDFYGTNNAKRLIIDAYKNKTKAVLHLKSELKELIYEDVFEEAVTSHKKGKIRWR